MSDMWLRTLYLQPPCTSDCILVMPNIFFVPDYPINGWWKRKSLPTEQSRFTTSATQQNSIYRACSTNHPAQQQERSGGENNSSFLMVISTNSCFFWVLQCALFLYRQIFGSQAYWNNQIRTHKCTSGFQTHYLWIRAHCNAKTLRYSTHYLQPPTIFTMAAYWPVKWSRLALFTPVR